MSDSNAPLVLFCAGGTGGHVYPALAVAQELQARGYRIAWVGTRAGLESRVVPEAGFTLHYLPVQGVRGKRLMAKLRALFCLVIAVTRALWLVLRLRPACVIGMGGYAAGPAGIAAWILRRPLIIHEQNAVAGTTNRMLAPFARKIVAAFDGAFGTKRATEVTGNPLRRSVIEARPEGHYNYDGNRPLRLLVLGGSLGAAALNDAVPGTLLRLFRTRPGAVALWHQTGPMHLSGMANRYAGLQDADIRVEAFIEDMDEAYRWADLVLCRAGALTVSELAVTGTPAILVPLPSAVDDHQRRNARALAAAGAAIILQQSELDAYRLGADLSHLMDHPAELAAMSAAAYRAGTPGATARIADLCEELINGR